MDKENRTATPSEVKPNTGQGATHSPAAVGAGPGNQVQDNITRPDREDFTETELRPGAVPDGNTSVATRTPQPRGSEEINQPGNASALD